jgi:uncharacterized membrane protein HdeD (DUF308 family)
MEAASPQEPGALREVGQQLAKYWWLLLVSGIAWLGIAYIVLQFDQASVTTVGVLVGIMFLISGMQQLALAGLVTRGRWFYAIFGVLFLIAGVIALISPENTFAAIADILGFLFLMVGTFWLIEAFESRAENELWWLGLISGLMMLVLAFWTSGQFNTTKAYTLLIFAGIWALMHGVTNIVRAFQLRRLAA